MIQAVAGLSQAQKLQLVVSYVVVSGLLQRVVAKRTQPGYARLLCVLPLAVGHFCIPALFNPVTEFLVLGLLFLLQGWLATFKVIGLGLGRGPLSSELSTTQYLLLLNLPITTAEAGNAGYRRTNSRSSEVGSAYKDGDLVKGSLEKLLLLGCLLWAIPRWQEAQWPWRYLRNYMYGCLLYTFMGFFMDVAGVVLHAGLGMQLAPHFDMPYLSCSFSDFWSRRWNLTCSSALRFLTYDPIVEGALVKPERLTGWPSQLRRMLGTQAAFLTSGLVHESFLWYVGERQRWEFVCFFGLQAPLCMMEQILKPKLQAQGWNPPKWLGAVLFTLLQLELADRFFFPSLQETGLATRFIEQCSSWFGHLLPWNLWADSQHASTYAANATAASWRT